MQETDEREQIKRIFDIDRYNKLVVEREKERLVYHAILDTDEEYSSLQLDEIMKNNTYIRSIERCDESWDVVEFQSKKYAPKVLQLLGRIGYMSTEK